MAVLRKISIILLLIIFPKLLVGQEESWFSKNAISKEDGALDLSTYLNNKVGIIPLPVLVTEPAVGYGGGLGLIYFHPRKKDPFKPNMKGLPPSLSMVGAIATENGSYLIVLGHQGSYLNDFLRYSGAIGHPNVNLKFYGDAELGSRFGLDFNVNGFFIFQEFLTRINKQLPLFLGLNYIYFGNDIKFNEGFVDPGDLTEQTSTAGVNFVVSWDERDNIFTPNSGGFAAFDFGIHDQVLGGDRNYNNVKFRGYYYLNSLIPRTVIGSRYNIHYKWGDVPFYELPAINLRGIPALRYQSNLVNTAEVEARVLVVNRWSLIGFGGVGSATESFESINLDNLKFSYGTGFRYELARDYGLHLGLDFAWGPEQFAWYLTFGSAWFR